MTDQFPTAIDGAALKVLYKGEWLRVGNVEVQHYGNGDMIAVNHPETAEAKEVVAFLTNSNRFKKVSNMDSEGRVLFFLRKPEENQHNPENEIDPGEDEDLNKNNKEKN